MSSPAVEFILPPEREATAPPERRGIARDGVRLLRSGYEGVTHHVFRDLPDLLEPGDLVVINTSATLPAALDGRHPDGRPAPVHFSTRLDDGDWIVELRRPDGTGPVVDAEPGERISLPGGVVLVLGERYPEPSARRMWRAGVAPAREPAAYLARYGRPISYGYVPDRHPITDYQTVYATEPGSAEMPSAGRPFTHELLVRLVARGVSVAPVVLHAGVSSMERWEPPLPEKFSVPGVTARLVNGTREAGGRVVAVGTTVVRALETVSAAGGALVPGSGWTSLVLGPDRPARTVNGLVTGLHAPDASHLLLLEALGGPDLVRPAYEAAIERGYLWHEFGDSMLFLP